MELVLVRHAQPEWSRNGAAVVDPGLTELGHRQAEAVAQRLSEHPFDLLLTSTATRARETTDPIEKQLGLTRRVTEWLHEIHLPSSWGGSPAEEVAEILSEARGRPRADWWEGLAEGESFRDFHQRVCSGIDAMLDGLGVRPAEEVDGRLWHVEDDELSVLIVAHAGTNSVVLGHLLGIDPQPWEWERFASAHASITVLRTAPVGGAHLFSLRRFSEIAHLLPDLVSA